MFTLQRHVSASTRSALALLITACADAPQAPSSSVSPTATATPNVVIEPSHYAMMTLPLLPGAIGSEANAINDYGDIVGVMHFPGYKHAVRWNRANGGVDDLGVPPGHAESSATDINNAGWIVGKAWGGSQGTRPFLYTHWLGLRSITSAPNAAYANAVSDDGYVVGGSLYNVAWRWTWETGVEVLPTPTPYGNSEANDVIAGGSIVGRAYAGASTEAHMWSPNGALTSLGWLPGGTFSVATASSSSGVVVGNATYSASNRTHAFMWTYGSMQDLGGLAENYSAADVSTKGRIVGTIWPDYRAHEHDQAWTWKNGAFAYLTTPFYSGWLSKARGVNSCGTIVGVITDPSTGDQRAVRWMARVCE